MGVKQDVVVRFGSVDQRRGEKHLLPGKLTEARNVQQTEEGSYVKREGFTTYTRAPDAGSITTGEGLSSVDEMPVIRTANSVYVRDTGTNVDKYRGSYTPVLASWEDSGLPGLSADGAPSHYLDPNGNVWVFGTYAITGVKAYYYRIYNKTTGAVVKDTTLISADDCYAGKPVATGSFLFFVYWTTAGAFKLARFTIATPTVAPTLTTPYTAVLGTIYGFDTMKLTTNEVIVGICRSNSMVFFIIDAAGAFKAAPGAVSFTGGFTGFYCPGGFAKNSNQGGGSVYWHGCATTAAGVSASVVELAVNPTTLVAASTTLDAASAAILADTSNSFDNGTMTSYVALNGDRHVFFTRGRGVSITKYVRGAGTTISTFPQRGMSFVTDPVNLTIGGISSWFTIAQGDRLVVGLGPAYPNYYSQHSWYLVDLSDGRKLARIKWGDAGHYGQGGFLLSYFVERGFATNISVDGNIIRFAHIHMRTQDVAGMFSLDVFSLDIDPVVGQPVRIDGDVIFPGAYPMRLDRNMQLVDACPSQYPEPVTTTNAGSNASTGTYTVACCYEFRLPGDRVLMSIPSLKIQQAIVNPAGPAITCPTLRMLNSNIGVFIRFYVASVNQSTPCMLQKIVPNDPTVDSVTFTMTGNPQLGEPLYTDGGALDNEPLPSFSFGFEFNRRLFLTGCPTRDTWYSNEIIPGRAVGFNGARTVGVHGVCGGPVDGNYAAILEADAIYVISGDGMDDIGTGGFDLRKLPVTMGTTLPICCPSPIGLFFVGKDGGIWLIARDLQVIYIGRGVDDFRSSTVTAMADVPKAQHVRVTLSSGTHLIADYGRLPLEPGAPVDQLLQWYVWTPPGTPVGTLAIGGDQWFLSSNGELSKQVAGQFFDATNTWYGMKCTLPLSFAGIPGYEAVNRGVFIGNYIAPHQLKITTVRDGTSTVHGPVTVTDSAARDFRPAPRKGANWTFTVEELQQASNLNAAFTFEGIGFSVMVKPGLKRNATRM